jgi:hypothetical protein
VVARADHDGVAVRLAALAPGLGVVYLAKTRRGIAALDGAAALFDGGHDPLRAVGEAAGAAQVEDLGVAVEDGGDDPRLAGQLAGQDGEMVWPVSSCAAFNPPSRVSSCIRTTTVALRPPVFGSFLVG